MQRAIVVAVALLVVSFLLTQSIFAQDSTQNSEASAQAQQAGSSAKDSKTTEKDTDRKWHVRLGTISVGAGYSHYSSPYFYPYYDYEFYPYSPFYSSLLWSPYWGYMYPDGYFHHNDGKGEVKLSAPKQADVYIDDAYAGKAEKLKSMWLEPGAYNLSVSGEDRATYHQRIYVLSGKSLKIDAKLEQPPTPEKN